MLVKLFWSADFVHRLLTKKQRSCCSLASYLYTIRAWILLLFSPWTMNVVFEWEGFFCQMMYSENNSVCLPLDHSEIHLVVENDIRSRQFSTHQKIMICISLLVWQSWPYCSYSSHNLGYSQIGLTNLYSVCNSSIIVLKVIEKVKTSFIWR